MRLIDCMIDKIFNKKPKDTRIIGYCASSTECSDNNLKKHTKKIKLAIKRSERKKKQNVGIFESHRKIDQLENSIEKK